MAERGFPFTRNIVRQFILAVLKKSGRSTRFNMETGPSDKWFRRFFERNPDLTQREAERLDRGRQRMSNQKVMDQYFELLGKTIKHHNLNADQIFNCDETGWSGKEKSKTKVIGVKGHHSYQQTVSSTGHITGHLCISADGRILPSFLIFENSLPHTAYKDGVPDSWLFGHSESGYMDKELFLNWLKRIFIPNCGSKIPVLLIMDNHDSHINIDVIDTAIENQIELLGLPAHTTHILQPLDVHINGPLKAKVSSTAVNLGHINKYETVNKAKFPVVLSHAIDNFCSPARIKDAFRETGISPFNPDAIDKTQLIPTHTVPASSPSENEVSSEALSVEIPSTSNDPSSSDVPIPSQDTSHKSSSTICVSCGTFLGGNPLVTEGLIPEHLADIFLPVPCKPIVKRRKMVTEARVLTSAEFVNQMKEKSEEEKKKKDQIAQRKREREEKKQQKEEQAAKKAKKTKQIKSTTTKKKDIYRCKVCNLADPEDDKEEPTVWIQCDICDRWYHPECVGMTEEEVENDELEFRCQTCVQMGEE